MTDEPTTSEPLWTDATLTNPHDVDDKARRVRQMFADIAPSYDCNNRLHSLGRDQAWRRAAVRLAGVGPDDHVLDVACGTGDLTMAFADVTREKVIGIDFTREMLDIARKKAKALPRPPDYVVGDAMQLPIADKSMDVLSIAFGIRNVADPAVAISEFYRVLRPGGRVVILEFSQPRNRILSSLYQFYFRHIMPRTAAFIARDRSGAYRYLPRSVNTFLDRAQMLAMLESAGFIEAVAHPLTFGIAVVYRAIKP